MKSLVPFPRSSIGLLLLLAAAPLLAAPARRPPRTPAPPAPTPPPGVVAEPKTPGLSSVLPTNARLSREAARLETLAARGAWDEWLRVYQQLVEDRSLLLRRGDRILVGMRYSCHAAFASLPAAIQRKLVEQLQPEAAKALAAAAAGGEPAEVADVASRYRFTPAGRRALRWLGDYHLDRGQAGLARLAYARLAGLPDASAEEILRLAVAEERLGRTAESARALDRVRKEFGNAPLRLAGAPSTGAQAAGQVAALRQTAEREPPLRRPFAGGQGSGELAAGPLQKLWEYRLPGKLAEVPDYYYYYGRTFRYLAASDFRFLSFPLCGTERIYVQGPRRMTVLDAASGKPVWESAEFLLPPDESSATETDGRGREIGPCVYPTGRAFQAAPVLEGALIAARVSQVPGGRGDDAWPGKPGLAVYRARDGAPLWQASAGKSPFDVYYNLPALRDGAVFTGVARLRAAMTEYQAVALDAATGEAIWRTELGGGGHPGGALDGSPALVEDDLVWLETSHHALAALDRLTGEPRLIYEPKVPPDEGARGRSLRLPPDRNLSLLPATGGRLLYAPRWGSEVVALDPAAAKVAWTQAKPEQRGENTVGALFAVDDRRAYLCGRYVRAVNLADGKEAWTWTTRAETTGTPALAGGRVYFPVDGKVQVLAADDGRPLEVIDLGGALGTGDTYASLSVAGGRLIAVTADRVVAFGKP